MSLMKCGVLSAVIGLALALPGSASGVPAMSVGQAVVESKALVHGVVEDQFSQWEEFDEHRIVFTYSTVRVQHADFKALPRSRDVVVRTVGGTVDGYTQVLIDEASFTLGEEVVVFLDMDTDWAHLVVTGFHQGKYTVVRDGSGRISGFRQDAGAQVDKTAAAQRPVMPLATFAAELRNARRAITAREDVEIHPLTRVR